MSQIGLKQECQNLATELIKAYGMLSYAEARVVQGYTKDAVNATSNALSHIIEAKMDKEDAMDIRGPMEEIISSYNKLNRTQIQSRLVDAQEEILAIAGPFIAGCQCGPLFKK